MYTPHGSYKGHQVNCDLFLLFGRFQAAGVDQIRRAFKALDTEGKGELSVEEVKKYFGKQG